MADQEINPCPFCGGECETFAMHPVTFEGERVDKRFHVNCECGYESTLTASETEAIDAHNRIAPPRWIPIEKGLPAVGEMLYVCVLVAAIDKVRIGQASLTAAGKDTASWEFLQPRDGLKPGDRITHYRRHVTPTAPEIGGSRA